MTKREQRKALDYNLRMWRNGDRFGTFIAHSIYDLIQCMGGMAGRW
jgi:hypothetical protein